MDKIGKGSDLRKEKWGSPNIQESKITEKFSKRLSIRTVTPLRDISEKTWVHSYPMMPHAFTFHKKFAPLASCLPSWFAMHDVCVTCAKKCAATMGANALLLVLEISFSGFRLCCCLLIAILHNRSCCNEFEQKQLIRLSFVFKRF